MTTGHNPNGQARNTGWRLGLEKIFKIVIDPGDKPADMVRVNIESRSQRVAALSPASLK